MAIPVFTDSEARSKLSEILQRPEFVRNDMFAQWFQNIDEFLTHLLSRIMGKPVKIGSLGIWEDVLSFLAALFVLVIFIYVGSRLYRFFYPEYFEESIFTQEAAAADENQLRSQAAASAEKGDFRDAIRYQYLSLLLFLDKKQLIRFRFSKTNHEYLQEYRISEGGTETESFAGLLAFFERKWYGMEPCNECDYQEFRAMYMCIVREK